MIALIDVQLPRLAESCVPSARGAPGCGVIVGATVFATASPQFGCDALAASTSSLVLEPFGVIADSGPAGAPAANTISSPPGAQLGDDSVTLLLVSCCRFEPSAFMTNSSEEET